MASFGSPKVRHALMTFRTTLCALLLVFLGCGIAAATVLPPAAGSPEASAPALYTDRDVAARAAPLPILGESTRSGARRDRLRTIERALGHFGEQPFLLTERGYVRHQLGQRDAAEADFARAKVLSANDAVQSRRVHWSHGWAMFDAGHYPAALEAWAEAERLHGGRPFWVPYTRMLAEWQLGRRDLAMALYATAVNGDASWGAERGLAAKTANWPKSQSDVAAAIHHAWRESAQAPATLSP